MQHFTLPLLFLGCAAAATTAAASSDAGSDDPSFGSKPHLVILLADNLGWANVGYHRPPAADPREFATAHVDALAAGGLELRPPLHVQVLLAVAQLATHRSAAVPRQRVRRTRHAFALFPSLAPRPGDATAWAARSVK